MTTPVLETGEILLRPPEVADAQAIFTGWTSDPEATKFMRFSTHQSLADTVEWLTAEEENRTGNRVYAWLFTQKATGEVFGSGGLYWQEDQSMFELGFIIAKKYWNQGLTTRCAKAMISFARSELAPAAIFACHATANPASGKVLEKLGFAYRQSGRYTSVDGTRTFESKEYILYPGN
ncbi:MAG: GNAT family N-acetyltransferase [Oscillospiraceae bacterium]|nr:GNAT family N-acetyltransferase [Oscillospiraceae bacterium]